FRPASVAEHKLKRTGSLSLDLAPTSDIAAEAVSRAPGAFHIGFALESRDLLESARAKLARKGQQLVVANAIDEEHSPFGADTNRVALVTVEGAVELPLMSKREVAAALWDEVLRRLQE